jgi:hypothetical protein
LSPYVVKMTLSIDYLLERDWDPVNKVHTETNRKYYITYSLGGQIEGKVLDINPDRNPVSW